MCLLFVGESCGPLPLVTSLTKTPTLPRDFKALISPQTQIIKEIRKERTHPNAKKVVFSSSSSIFLPFQLSGFGTNRAWEFSPDGIIPGWSLWAEREHQGCTSWQQTQSWNTFFGSSQQFPSKRCHLWVWSPLQSQTRAEWILRLTFNNSWKSWTL